ncbi:MAG: CPBP family intramembrane glutamic endopeptidase [Eubacteriales bacterium]
MSDEKILTKTINLTAFALILNLALFLASGYLLDWVITLMNEYGTALSETQYYLIYDLCDIFTYALSFFIPALVLARMCGERLGQCVSLRISLPRHPLCCIAGALGIMQAAGIVSDSVLNFFYSFGFDISTDYYQYVPSTAPEIITLFISLVIIPAVFEELLFRGVILSRLARFGPSFGIVVSGVLFGLMHCSTSQFFYACVGGMVMAYLTLTSGSVWLAVFIHMLNNLISFAFIFIDAYAAPSANIIIGTVLTAMMLCGGLAAALRIVRDDAEAPSGLISAYGEPQYTVKTKILVRRAFSPLMIVYIVFSLGVLASRFFTL